MSLMNIAPEHLGIIVVSLFCGFLAVVVVTALLTAAILSKRQNAATNSEDVRPTLAELERIIGEQINAALAMGFDPASRIPQPPQPQMPEQVDAANDAAADERVSRQLEPLTGLLNEFTPLYTAIAAALHPQQFADDMANEPASFYALLDAMTAKTTEVTRPEPEEAAEPDQPQKRRPSPIALSPRLQELLREVLRFIVANPMDRDLLNDCLDSGARALGAEAHVANRAALMLLEWSPEILAIPDQVLCREDGLTYGARVSQMLHAQLLANLSLGQLSRILRESPFIEDALAELVEQLEARVELIRTNAFGLFEVCAAARELPPASEVDFTAYKATSTEAKPETTE